MADLARNRKAYHDYHVLETIEAGVSLVGTEVKSCRQRNVSIGEGYARITDGEIFLYNVHISEYEHGNRNNHAPTRVRRLLLHKREISKLAAATQQKGLTLTPLRLYSKRGRIKVELGLCRGKKLYDKRDAMRQREVNRKLRAATRRRS